MNQNPLTFPADVEITAEDCAAYLNLSLQDVSLWAFIQMIVNALNIDSGWYNFLDPIEWGLWIAGLIPFIQLFVWGTYTNLRSYAFSAGKASIWSSAFLK